MNPESQHGHTTHTAPVQLYSDEAANKALILALGIMGTAGLILIIGLLLSAFYLRTTPQDGIVHGITTALIICTISTIFPMSFAIHLFNKANVSQGH